MFLITNKNQSYPSAISPGIIIFLVVVYGISFIPIFTEESNITPTFILLLLPVVFTWYVFASIKYVIEDETLSVRAMFIREEIPIREIKSIAKTRTLLAAPAGSLDRIRISWGTYGVTVISPKHRKLFIDHLLSINPNIKIDAELSS